MAHGMTRREFAIGQTLSTSVDEIKGGDKSFSIRLKEPFPSLLDARAKVSCLVPFIMPERLAKTGPCKQVTEAFEPGHKVGKL